MLSIAVNFLSHMLGYAVVHLRLYVFLRVLCVIFFLFIQLVHCSPLTSDDFHQSVCSITSIFSVIGYLLIGVFSNVANVIYVTKRSGFLRVVIVDKVVMSLIIHVRFHV